MDFLNHLKKVENFRDAIKYTEPLQNRSLPIPAWQKQTHRHSVLYSQVKSSYFSEVSLYFKVNFHSFKLSIIQYDP